MSLANRPISLNNLQEIAISGGQYYSKYLGSKFKIQGSEKFFSIQPLWIQDSRLRKRLLQSHLFGFKIQDSRLRKNFFKPTSLDSRFKIQGSEKKKTSSTPPVWIQDSRFKAQKSLLQSHLSRFEIQDSRLRKNFFNPTSLDSRFKAQKKLLQANLFGFKIQGSEKKTSSTPPVWIQDSRFKAEGLRIQEVFLGS